VIDPPCEEDLKKINSEEISIEVPCILKSIARILVNCLRPTSEAGWERMWSSIERIFSIIAGLIDHTHDVDCMSDFLIFMKEFVKAFLLRYRNENGMHEEINEDYVEEYSGKGEVVRVIDEKYRNLFNQIWIPLIPELLYLGDGEIRAAKILSDLAIFDSGTYLAFILGEIKNYLEKDLTIY
jgi:hypothetical protein